MKKPKVDKQLFYRQLKKIILLTEFILSYKRLYSHIAFPRFLRNEIQIIGQSHFTNNIKDLNFIITLIPKYCSVNTYIQEDLYKLSLSEHHIGFIYYQLPLVNEGIPLTVINGEIYNVKSNQYSPSDTKVIYKEDSKILNFIDSFHFNNGHNILENRGVHLLHIKKLDIDFYLNLYQSIYSYLKSGRNVSNIGTLNEFITIVFQNTINKLLLDFYELKIKQINYTKNIFRIYHNHMRNESFSDEENQMEMPIMSTRLRMSPLTIIQ